MSKKVLIAIADGTEEMEAVCIIDTLRRAGAEVTVASVNRIQIAASRSVKIVADTLIDNCLGKEWDLVVLPGGMPGAENLRDSEDLIKILKKQAQSGRLYAAICASPVVVLQHHGLLENKKATCYPSLHEELINTSDENVVVDENCVTSKGPATAIEFALKLTELLFGEEKAKKIASEMLVK